MIKSLTRGLKSEHLRECQVKSYVNLKSYNQNSARHKFLFTFLKTSSKGLPSVFSIFSVFGCFNKNTFMWTVDKRVNYSETH